MKRTISYPFGAINIMAKIRSKRIFSVNTSTGNSTRSILNICKGMDLLKAMPFIERIDYSSHMHYSVCYSMLLEEASGQMPDDQLSRIRTLLLEKERLLSHLIYLNRIFLFAYNQVLVNLTELCINRILDEFEEISGNRTYTTLHRPLGLNQPFSIGNINYSMAANNEVKDLVFKIKRLVDKSYSIRSIYKGVAELQNTREGFTGPFSWYTQKGFDSRITNPYLAYKDTNVKDALSKKNIIESTSAYERIQAIIEDALCSCEIVNTLLKVMNEPSFRRAINFDELNFNKGDYSASIESPRGKLELRVGIGENGTIKNINIMTPSESNISTLIEAMEHTSQNQLQEAFESLYISALEIDK